MKQDGTSNNWGNTPMNRLLDIQHSTAFIYNYFIHIWLDMSFFYSRFYYW